MLLFGPLDQLFLQPWVHMMKERYTNTKKPQTYKFNHPNVKVLCSDISQVTQEQLESIIKADQSLTLFKQMGLFGQSYAFLVAEYLHLKREFNGGPVLIKAPE